MFYPKKTSLIVLFYHFFMCQQKSALRWQSFAQIWAFISNLHYVQGSFLSLLFACLLALQMPLLQGTFVSLMFVTLLWLFASAFHWTTIWEHWICRRWKFKSIRKIKTNFNCSWNVNLFNFEWAPEQSFESFLEVYLVQETFMRFVGANLSLT